MPRSPHPYRLVLTVLDGSPSSEAAADVAAELATRSGATLHIGTAVQREGAKVDLGEAAPIVEPGSREFAQQLEEHVDAVASRIGERWDCRVEATSIKDGETGNGLIRYENGDDVGLTVLGVRLARDHGGDEEVPRLRSDVAARLPSPLLLLPTTDDESGDERAKALAHAGPVAIVLGPYDAAGDSSLARHGAAFAKLLGSELWLIDSFPAGRLVSGWGTGSDSEVPEPVESAHEVRERLAAMSERLRVEGERACEEIIEGPDPRAALVDLLHERNISTVVVGPEGRGLAERLLFDQEPSKGEEARVPRLAVLLCPASSPPP